MATLTHEDLTAALTGLPGWAVEDGMLAKVFPFDGYPRAVLFTVACAHVAERADHHPDLLLTWGRVRVSLSTHSEGGITAKDVAMAKEIESLA
jgi:4a-hydroxytetrahydrobiopterin dehydratase